jgi:phytanoyl-CoA dioxygenase PhyH
MPREHFAVSLPDTAVHEFEQDGVTTLQRITSDAEARWLRGVYDRVLLGRLRQRLDTPGAQCGPMNNTLWLKLDRWETLVLSHTSVVRNATQIAAQLLAVESAAVQVGLRFFFKPKGGGRLVPWHQDEAHYDPRFDHHSLNVWVPFDDVGPDNGCLWYVRGSHREGIREHRHPGGGAPDVALMTDDVPLDRAVAVPLPMGGASFHHCRTLHCSGSNTTGEHRRALAIICSTEPVPRDRPNERPWFEPNHRVPDVSF